MVCCLKGKKGKGTEVGGARLALIVRQIGGKEGVMAGCVWVCRVMILFLCVGCLAGLCLLLLVFGPHVLETVYTSFKQSIGV